jgi:hypothetical protein
MKTRSFLSLLLAVTFLIPLHVHAQAVGDYDGDGTSDMSLALVDRSRNYTAYLTRRSGAPSTPLFWEFNAAADAFAPGSYFGDGKIYPAIVRVIAVGQPLLWNFKRPDGSELNLQYGLPGDTIPNHGPDFDGDGISDIYVVRDGTPTDFLGFKIWYIALSSTATVHRTVFGMSGDRVFAADVNGNGRAEMVALRPSTYEWFSADISATDVSQIHAQQWGLPGDIPLLPQDINGDGKPDYIISRREDGMQVAYIRFSNGTFEKRPLGFADSIPMVGRFDAQRSQADFAWQQRDTGWAASRNADTTLNLFLHGIAANAIIRPDGTVVQPNEDGRFPGGSVAQPSQPQQPGTPSGAPGCTPSPGTKDRFRGNGDLWKPVSESNGNVVILLPGSYSSATVDVLDRNGNVISNPARSRCCPNGGRMHWWMNRSASFMSQHAPVTARVRRGDITECRVVPDPRRRYE